jgi:GntR family transcriptional regulator, transcriptional repressor for pyruvate dehydrogenase complex
MPANVHEGTDSPALGVSIGVEPVRPAAGAVIFPSDSLTRPLKTSEGVARDIVQRIVSAGLHTGDRLPAEGIMREQYGVSRESLREALRLLEAQGLITIRRGPGGGPVVGRVDPASFGRISTLFYHLAGGTYGELFEAWALTESTLAERAARNRDRRCVRLAMRPFLEPPDGRWETATVDGFVRAHSRFHAAVASLAANRVLELMLQTIGQVVSRQITGSVDLRPSGDDIGRDHADVARAIASGRPAVARSRMEEHILQVSELYQAEIAVQMDGFIQWQ